MDTAPARAAAAPNPEALLVISYLTLRKLVGILGIALPFLVAMGARVLFSTSTQVSISAYYYTPMRDVFVGILCAIGLFLYSYQGHERRDGVAGNLACMSAIAMALFPTTQPGKIIDVRGIIHLACATLFFATLTYFSLFLFTKTNPNETPPRRKRQRNIVYRVCGGLMAACLLLMLIEAFLPKGLTQSLLPKDMIQSLRGHRVFFWLETTVIVTFGVSWLTKGQAILADRQ